MKRIEISQSDKQFKVLSNKNIRFLFEHNLEG